MANRCRRHHVECAGPYGRGAHHCATPTRLFCERDCRVCHGLFIVSSPGRKALPRFVQRLTERGDIPVAKNGPHTCEVRLRPFRHFHPLRLKPPHQCLSGGEAQSAHSASAVSNRLLRAARQPRASVPSSSAINFTAAASSIAPESHWRAASHQIVRPTANPFTMGKAAEAANDFNSVFVVPASPSTTTPRQ